MEEEYVDSKPTMDIHIADRPTTILIKWTDEMVVQLIKARQELGSNFTGKRGFAHYGWKLVAKKMGLPGHNTWKLLQKKFFNLTAKYKSMKHPVPGSVPENGDLGHITWKYYELMDSLLGESPYVMDVSSGFFLTPSSCGDADGNTYHIVSAERASTPLRTATLPSTESFYPAQLSPASGDTPGRKRDGAGCKTEKRKSEDDPGSATVRQTADREWNAKTSEASQMIRNSMVDVMKALLSKENGELHKPQSSSVESESGSPSSACLNGSYPAAEMLHGQTPVAAVPSPAVMNEDQHYCMSLAFTLQRLTPSARAKLKFDIQRLVYEAESEMHAGS